MSQNYINYIKLLLNVSKHYLDIEIESTIIAYITKELNLEFHYNDEFKDYPSYINYELLDKYKKISPPLEIDFL